MDSAQLRLCFFDVLRDLQNNGVNQFGGHLMQEIARHAANHNIMDAQPHGSERLPKNDQNIVRELFWSFIIQGIIMPGTNTANPDLPFFNLTEHGQKVIASPDPVPHDPDHYVEHLKEVAPSLDDITISYILEGLECFQRGIYTASVMMLGVAAEQITLVLAEAIKEKLPNKEAKNLQSVIQNRTIAKIYDEMMKRLKQRISQLPNHLADGLEGQLDGIFAVIRMATIP
jgi:hypothetical protein